MLKFAQARFSSVEHRIFAEREDVATKAYRKRRKARRHIVVLELQAYNYSFKNKQNKNNTQITVSFFYIVKTLSILLTVKMLSRMDCMSPQTVDKTLCRWCHLILVNFMILDVVTSKQRYIETSAESIYLI